MSRKTLHIVVLEPSYMVYEGLLSVLNQLNLLVVCRRAGSLQELQLLSLKSLVDVVVANPFCLSNQPKVLNALKRELSDTRWMALVYGCFDPGLLAPFDETISIYDSPETIAQKIRKPMIESTEKDLPELLSEREIEVLRQLVAGKTNKEIADALSISTHTVITHRKNISHKTGIKSVPGLTIYAVVNHLLTIETAS